MKLEFPPIGTRLLFYRPVSARLWASVSLLVDFLRDNRLQICFLFFSLHFQADPTSGSLLGSSAKLCVNGVPCHVSAASKFTGNDHQACQTVPLLQAAKELEAGFHRIHSLPDFMSKSFLAFVACINCHRWSSVRNHSGLLFETRFLMGQLLLF